MVLCALQIPFSRLPFKLIQMVTYLSLSPVRNHLPQAARLLGCLLHFLLHLFPDPWDGKELVGPDLPQRVDERPLEGVLVRVVGRGGEVERAIDVYEQRRHVRQGQKGDHTVNAKQVLAAFDHSPQKLTCKRPSGTRC